MIPTTFADWSARASDLPVGDLRVALHDEGTGAAVTFLHGYPSSSHDVVPVLARLGEHRVIAVDFPGFGASAKPVDHPYSIGLAADSVEAAWTHLGVDRTVLLAHDYGVSVAQELLTRSAALARITGVVWCNGGLYPDLHRPTLGQQLLLDPEHGAAIAAALDRDALANGLRATWGTRRPMTDDEVDAIWASMACDDGIRQAHRLLHYVADRRANAERWIAAFEQCPLPMRFVWGELDPVSGAHVADRLAQRLPHVPLHRLTDVGHWPPLEAPAEVAAAVQALSGH